MGKALAVAVVLFLSLPTCARARPAWGERLAARENPASGPDRTPGSVPDYVKTAYRPVTISEIGVSVRDGRAKLIDGHEVNGTEVVNVAPAGPAASAGIQSAMTAARPVLAPVVSLFQAIGPDFTIDSRDLIFAADGERIRNTLDLVDRVGGLAPGERMYLTIARRGRRVQGARSKAPLRGPFPMTYR